MDKFSPVRQTQISLSKSESTSKFVRWLTKIPDSLPDSTYRRSNLLAWLLAFIFLLASLSIIVVFWVNPPGSLRRLDYPAMIFAFMGILLLAFYWNRKGHFAAAAGLTVLLAFLAPWVSLALDPGIMRGDFVPLTYVMLSILLSSLLFNPIFTIILAAIQIIGLLFIPIFYSPTRVINWPSLLIFLFFASVFSIVSNVIRERDLRLIDQQTRRLRESEARLREESIRDPMTNLFNRRYLTETLDRELRRADREEKPLGLIMIDIDHFKIFNDSLGHAAGDELLKEFGKLLKKNLRESDIACRFGGEEFVLVLPGAPANVTFQRAEEMREKVNHLQVMYEGQFLQSVTISSGVAMFPAHANSSMELIKAADSALYQAKAEGRNRVHLADGKFIGPIDTAH